MHIQGLIDGDARLSTPDVAARADEGLWARASIWTIALSATLHALVAALFLITPRSPPDPVAEATPVEIWTAEELAAVSPPTPRPPPAIAPPLRIPPETAPASPLLPTTPPPAAPQPPIAGPRAHDPIRAATMLSAGVLASPRSRGAIAFLKTLDSDGRLEQLCNIEAMAQISSHFPELLATHVVAYAMGDTKISRNALTARGAAFRSKGDWINLSYECRSSADRQTIVSFEFTVGDPVPRRDWSAHNLPSIR